MKIETIVIKNFRSIKEVTLNLDAYTTLVGANGAGKSTVLAALNLFFGESCAPGTSSHEVEVDDFHKKDTSNNIEISLVFGDLTAEESKELSAYVRHGKLIVTSKTVFDPSTNKGYSTQYGSRLALAEFAKFFAAEANGAKVPELKKIYEEIRATFTDLPAPGSKDSMISNLHEYEESHPDKCVELPSSDQFYGIEKVGKLNKFIQWVYVPAVKDAHDEQKESKNGSLGKLLSRTVNAKAHFDEKVKAIQDRAKTEYQKLLDDNQTSLTEISTSLKNKLATWSHSNVNLNVQWSSDPSKSVQVAIPYAQLNAGEGSFEGQLSRLGHGLQRSYIIALLHELATSANTESSVKLLLGIEEPELYQHPPQIAHLADTLSKLANKDAQVIITTHSPSFVKGETYTSVRLCRQKNDGTEITRVDQETIMNELKNHEKALVGENGLRAKLYQTLQAQLAEMFFAKKVIFVEGVEDQAFITSLLEFFDKTDTYRTSGAHIIPVHGKNNFILPTIIAKQMKIPFMVVFDADGSTEEKDGRRAKQEKDNISILGILEKKIDPFPSDDTFFENSVVWKENITEAFQRDCGAKFQQINSEVQKSLDQAPNLKKNILAVAERVSTAKELGLELPIMKKLIDSIDIFMKS